MSDRSGEILAVVSGMADGLSQLRADFLAFTAGVRMELEDVKHRIATLERSRLPPMRDKESSWHDMDVELKKLRESMKRRVSNPADPMDPHQARDFVTNVIVEIDRGRELKTWQGIKGSFRRVVWYVVAGMIAAASMAYVAGHFEGRSTAKQGANPP